MPFSDELSMLRKQLSEKTESEIELRKQLLEQAKRERYMGGEKACKHCGKTKPIMEGFGLQRGPQGKVYPYAWCRKCRSEAAMESQAKDARGVPRERKPKAFTRGMLKNLTEDQRKRYFAIFDEVAGEGATEGKDGPSEILGAEGVKVVKGAVGALLELHKSTLRLAEAANSEAVTE